MSVIMESDVYIGHAKATLSQVGRALQTVKLSSTDAIPHLIRIINDALSKEIQRKEQLEDSIENVQDTIALAAAKRPLEPWNPIMRHLRTILSDLLNAQMRLP